MTVISFIPLLVCILGILVWVLATNAKLQEMGRLSFFAGLFVTLMTFATHVIRLGAP
jgi:hypothetical protein